MEIKQATNQSFGTIKFSKDSQKALTNLIRNTEDKNIAYAKLLADMLTIHSDERVLEIALKEGGRFDATYLNGSSHCIFNIDNPIKGFLKIIKDNLGIARNSNHSTGNTENLMQNATTANIETIRNRLIELINSLSN